MITVVIPVKNRAELVKRTLESLDKQTLRPEAVVLVDNGSTDNTLEVLQRWAEGKAWVQVITELKPGAAAARNAGLALVETPYVLFFDSDDVMPLRHIEQVAAGLVAAGCPKIAAFDMTLIDTKGVAHDKSFRGGNPMRNQIFHCILSTQRCVISTELVREVGGWNEAISVWDDWELGLRLLVRERNVAYIPLDIPVLAYAQAESLTGTSFGAKRGLWEATLDAAEKALDGTDYGKFIGYRRAILAGMYRREGNGDYAQGLVEGVKLKMIERYVAAGGRGVEYLARIFR